MEKNEKIVKAIDTRVACGGPGSHPKVFLHIDKRLGKITCPYCGKQFIFVPTKDDDSSGA